jgi:hypothetical protein
MSGNATYQDLTVGLDRGAITAARKSLLHPVAFIAPAGQPLLLRHSECSEESHPRPERIAIQSRVRLAPWICIRFCYL